MAKLKESAPSADDVYAMTKEMKSLLEVALKLTDKLTDIVVQLLRSYHQ